MCLNVRKSCSCGNEDVQFHLRDNVMTQEVILNLFCPQCSSDIVLDQTSMIYDNGWVIEYDMDIARFSAISKLTMEPELVQPGFIFDEGYASWQEIYPGEKTDVENDRQRIMNLMKIDKKRYLVEMSRWNIERINSLKEKGWRKLKRA